MNIFILDSNPTLSASYHCDKHIVKMPLETAQLLSTAHRVLDNNSLVYKATHINHPCSIWARKTNNNYNWLYNYWLELNAEYTKRYKKKHLSFKKLGEVLRNPPTNIEIGPLTPFPQAVPADLKCDSPVKAYRNYYIRDKAYMAKWAYTEIPDWFKKEEI